MSLMASACLRATAGSLNQLKFANSPSTALLTILQKVSWAKLLNYCSQRMQQDPPKKDVKRNVIVSFQPDHRLSIRNSSFFDVYNDESILPYPATRNARNFSCFFKMFCHSQSSAIIAHQYRFSIKSQLSKILTL